MTSGVGPYVVPLPVDTDPAAAVLETTIVAAMTPMVDLGIGGGVLANVETYNGSIPGPLLKLDLGNTVIVRLINLLDHPTGIHWHGIELSNSVDGTEVTQEPVLPVFPAAPTPPAPAGGSYLYKFTVTRPGLYWYHPHHHLSPNRVFRGLYGMIVVADPLEPGLIAASVIPGAADTMQLVLSDITVCKAVNDTDTYVAPAAEWMSGSLAQAAPAPVDLCEFANGATQDDGSAAMVNYGAGDIPSIIRPPGRINEGQTVLTNGMNVGARAGFPLMPPGPGTPAVGAHTHPVVRGQGLRLQIVNCATTRYFRLILSTESGVQVDLYRIGGEGGLIDSPRLEGGTIGTLNTDYLPGEILIPPASRADIVAAIPLGVAVGSTLTLWTRDFQRLGPIGSTNRFADLPTVPVMHLNVITGTATPTYTISTATVLRSGPDVVETLPAPTANLLTPTGGFVNPKFGRSTQDIKLSAGGGVTGVDSVPGHFENHNPYWSAPHIGSTRYAEAGRTLELSVTNTSPAHHPFHKHGFSFQPISLVPWTGASVVPVGSILAWPYQEFRDNIDIPGNYTLTFRVRLDDRALVDGATTGGAFGRWLFHCHIFQHHHFGMISELVVTDAGGKEKPNIDVAGSWAYAPLNGSAERHGTFGWLDEPVVSVTVTDAAGNNVGTVSTASGVSSGTWSWQYTSTGSDAGTQYLYATATDAIGLQDQAIFRLKIGAPDDGADNGDPHILTVDGKYYDFQAAGEFILLRDTEGLEIQVRQTPVPTATPITDGNSGLISCVSVNTAVSARIGAHRIAYQPARMGGDARLQFFLDGKAAELTEKGIDLDGGRVVAYPVGGATALRVDYANAAVLIVTPYFWNSYNIWLLNVSVSHTDADQGLMGRIPPQTWLPMLPNGATVGPKPADMHERYVALYRTFADAWRVTDKTSLFVYAPGTSTKTFTDRDWPAEKLPCTQVKPQFEIAGAKPPLVNIKPEAAERICKPVTIDDLHRGCVFDVATTGDRTLVQSYLLAQLVRFRSTAVQIVADKRLTRPGEPVTFTAAVSAISKDRPRPTGTVTFVVNEVAAGKPIDLDKSGHASLRIADLGVGVRRVRAIYTPGGETELLGSSSASLRHRIERKPPTDRSKAPYKLRGLFYEACDCFTICPCWVGSEPDGGQCTGVFAWEIEKGSIDGLDVSGLRVVSVSQHTDSRDDAEQRVVIFVDERATRQQADALGAAFSGRLGGPLQELAGMLGEFLGVERAPIVIRRDGRLTTLTVDHRIRIEGMTRESASGRPMAVRDGKLSNVLGSPAEVGESGRFQIALSAHGMSLDLRGRSTMSGRFSYVHEPRADARGSRRPQGGHR